MNNYNLNMIYDDLGINKRIYLKKLIDSYEQQLKHSLVVTVDDVMGIAEVENINLSKDQALAILDELFIDIDFEQGINYDVVQQAVINFNNNPEQQ